MHMKNSRNGFALILLILVAALAIGGSAYSFSQKKKAFQAQNTSDAMVPESHMTGLIQGRLGYPSEISPLQAVCALHITGDRKICTSQSDLVAPTITCGLSDWQNRIGERIPK